MIIVNAKLNDENAYDITISKTAHHRVFANSLDGAIDLVADYLTSIKATDLYYDALELEVMAMCSKYETAEAFAKAHNLIRCGANGIYLEITSVKGYPNG